MFTPWTQNQSGPKFRSIINLIWLEQHSGLRWLAETATEEKSHPMMNGPRSCTEIDTVVYVCVRQRRDAPCNGPGPEMWREHAARRLQTAITPHRALTVTHRTLAAIFLFIEECRHIHAPRTSERQRDQNPASGLGLRRRTVQPTQM